MIHKYRSSLPGHVTVVFELPASVWAGRIYLTGDFNDWYGTLGKILEAQLGVSEAFRQLHGHYAKTFPSNRPMLRMDRIYFRGIRLLDCACLGREPWDELSDHLPLYADFTFD